MADVSVITGGAGGMGFATARILGRDHRVLISDVDDSRLDRAAAELRQLDIACESMRCDVTDRGAVEALAERARTLGAVTAVVHTAGLSPQMGSPERIIAVNALGTLHVDEVFAASAHEGLAIVNVASAAGHLPVVFPVPRRAYELGFTDPTTFADKLVARCGIVPEKARPGIAYAISKHYVIWLSRRLAGRLGDCGARILSVSPGSFDTEMGRLEDAAGAGELARRSALGRYGTVEEIAEVLAFCASRAPGYLTGTDVLVDGGAKAVMTIRDTIAMARSR